MTVFINVNQILMYHQMIHPRKLCFFINTIWRWVQNTDSTMITFILIKIIEYFLWFFTEHNRILSMQDELQCKFGARNMWRIWSGTSEWPLFLMRINSFSIKLVEISFYVFYGNYFKWSCRKNKIPSNPNGLFNGTDKYSKNWPRSYSFSIC